MPKNDSKFEKVRATALALWDESIFRTGTEPSKFHKFVHFWVLAGRSFVRNRCPVRASALSYASLLALIPMLALAVSVTTSILKDEGADQIEHFIQGLIDQVMPPAVIETSVDENGDYMDEGPAGSFPAATTGPITNGVAMPATTSGSGTNQVLVTTASDGTNAVVVASDARVMIAQKEAARHIKQFIDNTSATTIGIPAMIALVFVAISMLTRIEETFNDIWGVTRGRNWAMRIVIYWTTITLGPLLLVGALGLASGPQFKAVQGWLSNYQLVGAIVFKLLPMFVLWLAFALLYKAVPNTKVDWTAALAGGMVGGSLWHLNNVFGFLYVSRVVTSNKIYGSLGLVPVFMFGLYLSWMILLFGAQVAYAFQNRSLYLQEKLAENVNQRGREFIALRLMTCLGQRFERGVPPPTIQEMSAELGIPSRLVQQVLRTLLAARLVTEVTGAEPAYTPARPLESINAHHVLMAMRAIQGQELITRDEPVREEVYGEFTRIQKAEESVASSISMMALVNRAEARLELNPAPTEEIKLTPALAPVVPVEKASQPANVPAFAEPQPSTLPEAAGESHGTVASAAGPAARNLAEPVPDNEREFPL